MDHLLRAIRLLCGAEMARVGCTDLSGYHYALLEVRKSISHLMHVRAALKLNE